MHFSTISRQLFYSCVFHSLLQFILNLSINDLTTLKGVDVYFPPNVEGEKSIEKIIRILLEGYTRWDAQHFLFIADKGYQLEKNLAFLPLFPLLIRCIAEMLNFITFNALSSYSCLIMAGFLISNLCYILSGSLLHRLTIDVFKSEKMADVSLTLYMVNPASIFFHAIYTQSCYFLLVIYGLGICRKAHLDKYAIIKACVLFSMSSLIRSNGLLNFGYVIQSIFSSTVIPLIEGKKFKLRTSWVSELFNGLCSIMAGLTPFFALQYYLYRNLCTVNESTDFLSRFHSVFHSNAKPASFCAKFYLPYMAIHDKYWNVGFLQYFKMISLLAFVLAAPCLTISLAACKFFWRPKSNNFLGYMFQRNGLAPHILHCFLLAVYCLLFVNVEISTRLLFSSSPLLLWFCARQFDERKLPSLQNLGFFSRMKILFYCGSFQGRLILIYFLGYAFVGTLLHVNFYLWI